MPTTTAVRKRRRRLIYTSTPKSACKSADEYKVYISGSFTGRGLMSIPLPLAYFDKHGNCAMTRASFFIVRVFVNDSGQPLI